jgi:hypothetical protein
MIHMKMIKCAFIILASVLSGCVLFPSQEMPVPQCQSYPDTCLMLDLPPAIPENVYISLEPGKPPNANAGGQELIRNYAALRKRIKLWQESQH